MCLQAVDWNMKYDKKRGFFVGEGYKFVNLDND